MSAGGRAPSQRLFFASWPDATTCATLLAAAARQLPGAGRAVPAENVHLTLEFLGAVPVADLDRLLAIGAALAWPATELSLDRLDWWSRARIVVAASSRPSPALFELHARLHQCLGAAGFRVDAQPFRPHVTLRRDAAAVRAETLAPPVAWRLVELVLVASETARGGSRYRPLARWSAAG